MGRRQRLLRDRDRCDPRRVTARAARLILALAAARLFVEPAAGGKSAMDERRSGYEFMSRETRAMQDDDAGNPGTLWLLDGEALWKRKAGTADRACSDCHGDARESMKAVAARYPAFDPALRRPVNLEQRINACRVGRQKAPGLAYESKDLLALTAYVARQSRGLPINITIDARTKPFLEAGRQAFRRRQGQLNLACAQCHDEHWSGKLAGSPITQAHPTGYPLYRLEWQGLRPPQRPPRGRPAAPRPGAHPP